ncbi:hypothetical protein BDN72DRAFT_863625 [Pluteus cervinus]|uniref:Uncharacterized protein n=1 Tax=Pluteus cervinus TaxID=181527 RepID=A0ACD3A9C2_9AGAR|nr:hypothetical protein BDN72DRAFT_863625 [Pluteus cervinus]
MEPRYSDVVGALLFTYFRPYSTAMDDPNLLKFLDLSCAPSVTNTPMGWTDGDAKSVGRLRERMRRGTYPTNVDFLQSGDDCIAGRIAWEDVFRRDIGKRISKSVHDLLFKSGRHPVQLMDAEDTHDLPDFAQVRGKELEEQVGDLFGPSTGLFASWFADPPSPASKIVDFVLENFRKDHGRASRAVQQASEKLDKAMEPIFRVGVVSNEEANFAIEVLHKFEKIARCLPLYAPKFSEYADLVNTKVDLGLVRDIDEGTLELYGEEVGDEDLLEIGSAEERTRRFAILSRDLAFLS